MSGIVIGGVPVGTQSMDEFYAQHPEQRPQLAPADDDVATHRFSRSASGGTPGHVYACTWTQTDVAAGSRGHEWNAVHVLNNRAADGENCGMYSQANTYAGGATWGLCADVRDMSQGQHYPFMIGAEISVAPNGADPGSRRVGVHVALNPAWPGTAAPGPTEAAHGIKVTGDESKDRRWNDALMLRDYRYAGLQLRGTVPGGPSQAHRAIEVIDRHIVGVDTSQATFESGTALRLGNGQCIALEGTESARLRCLDGKVQVLMLGVPVFEIDLGSGDLRIKGSVGKL
jgi:hypothetical protein